jgi:hypothetical protein
MIIKIDDFEFLEIFKEYPILFDSTMPKHHLRGSKNKALDDLPQSLKQLSVSIHTQHIVHHILVRQNLFFVMVCSVGTDSFTSSSVRCKHRI